jgi:hypothetical protein
MQLRMHLRMQIRMQIRMHLRMRSSNPVQRPFGAWAGLSNIRHSGAGKVAGRKAGKRTRL